MDPTIPTSSSSLVPFSPYQLSIDFGEEAKSSSKVQCVVDSLPYNPVLHSLDLSARTPKRGPVSRLNLTLLQSVASALLTNTALRILNLNSIGLPKKGYFDLGSVLRMNSTLTALHLNSCLAEKKYNSLGKDLKSNSTLTALSLYECYIGGKCFRHITEILKKTHTLRELNLGYMARERPFDEMLNLTGALKINSSLTVLNFSQNTLFFGESFLLAEVLAANSTLTTLNLAQTCKREQEVNATLQALLTNSHLTTLNLRLSATASSSTLESVLKTNTTLTSLDLSYCGLEAEGALAIGRALIVNSTLLELNLSWNPIAPNGFCGLAGSLLTNSTLTNLNLAGSSVVDSTGARVMTEVLRTNSTLTFLSFGNEQVSPNLTEEEWTDFFRTLGENPSLTTFELYDKISCAVAPLISTAIQSNTVLGTLRLKRLGFTRAPIEIIAQAFQTNGSLTDLDITDYYSIFQDFEKRNQHNLWQKEISLFALIRDTFTEALYSEEIAAVSSMGAQAGSSDS